MTPEPKGVHQIKNKSCKQMSWIGLLLPALGASFLSSVV